MKISPAKLQFIHYLQRTLIPDLIESGSEATADDFKIGIIFATTDADKVYFVSEAERGAIIDFDREWYVEYLRTRLIPDLRESGKDATALDFSTLARFITH